MIETKRLILRPVDPDRDFEAWARCMGNEDTVRYLGVEPMNRAEAWRHMACVMGHWQIRGYGFFSVELKDTGEWVGRVGPWNPEGWPAPEVGWTVSPDHLRKGYATEAARAALDYVFKTLKWPKVSHVILDGNEASIGVAENIGSRYLLTQDGVPGIINEKVHVYGQSNPATS